VARKAAVWLIFPNHCRVSVYLSLHLVMPGKHNNPLLLFSNCGMWFLDLLSRCLNCGARKPIFSHFGHVQGKRHVGLFKLYPISLSCHSSWHVENLQHISCCFESENQLLPQPYMTLQPPLRSSKSVWSIPGDIYHQIGLRKSQNSQHHDVQFRGLCEQMP